MTSVQPTGPLPPNQGTAKLKPPDASLGLGHLLESVGSGLDPQTQALGQQTQAMREMARKQAAAEAVGLSAEEQGKRVVEETQTKFAEFSAGALAEHEALLKDGDSQAEVLLTQARTLVEETQKGASVIVEQARDSKAPRNNKVVKF